MEEKEEKSFGSRAGALAQLEERACSKDVSAKRVQVGEFSPSLDLDSCDNTGRPQVCSTAGLGLVDGHPGGGRGRRPRRG